MTPKQAEAYAVIQAAESGITMRALATALSITYAATVERVRSLRRLGVVGVTHQHGGCSCRICTVDRVKALRAEIAAAQRAREEAHNRSVAQRMANARYRRPVWQRVPNSVWALGVQA